MKIREGGSIILLIVAGLALMGALSHKVLKDKHHTDKPDYEGHDNPLEEASEAGIKHITGFDVDLTPDSLEK